MTKDPRVKDVGDLRTSLLFDMVVDLQPRQNIGDGGLGRRVFFESAGGRFDGPDLQGEVLPGGGDWALFRADGVMSLDVRLSLRARDGALIQMTYGGRWAVPADVRPEMAEPQERHTVDPARYYFRTNPLFETGAPAYAWLNDVVCVGIGYLVEGGVAYKVFRVH
jgi:hypothetical protein